MAGKRETPITLVEPDPADHRAAVIAEALGDGPDLTEDEQRVLAVLTDPDVNDYVGHYGDDIEDVVESLANDGSGYDMEDLRSLAQRLEARTQMDSNDSSTGTMSFEADGEAGSYTVGVYCGHDVGYLSTSSDLKYLAPDRGFGYDEDVSGLRKAVRIASVIDGDFNMMKSRAVRLGLVPKADQAPGAPDVHAARQALADLAATPADGDIDVDTIETMREQLQAYVDAENAPRPSV